ncbi:hypothetical protein D3C81_2275600 [compost metagenome]
MVKVPLFKLISPPAFNPLVLGVSDSVVVAVVVVVVVGASVVGTSGFVSGIVSGFVSGIEVPVVPGA